MENAELVDLIYEGAADPDIFVKALHEMSQWAGALGGVLFTVGSTGARWVASEGIYDTMFDFVNDGWVYKNPRVPAALRLQYPGFVADNDFLSEAEMDQSDVYTEFLRPRNAGWAIGTLITPTDGNVITVSLERAYDRGPVPQTVKTLLDPLRPHIARSALLAGRLGLERSKGMVSSLGILGLPAAVLAWSGHVIASNEQLERSGYALSLAGERLALLDPNGNRWLRESLGRGRLGKLAGGSVLSYPLLKQGAEAPTVGHLVPLVRSTRDIFNKGDVLLILSELGGSGPPGPAILEALFDLTPTEALIARGVANGRALEVVSAELGIQVSTARSHLKRVFQKTGVDRQASLVHILAAVLPK